MKKSAILVFVLSTLLLGRGALRAPGSLRSAWTEPSTGMTFGLVPAGTFQMGTPLTETGREAQEVPHAVTLTKSFYLGRHEVTQAQWKAVMGTNPSRFQGCDTCPVERVSLHDVDAFIARLNERSGPGFRLPTEAEWEKACRAGSAEPFGRTAALGSTDANIEGTQPYGGAAGIARGKTTPVGQFPPNALGLFDMQGNVWEWTSDWYCLYRIGRPPIRAVCARASTASSAAAAGLSTATVPAAAFATLIGRRIPDIASDSGSPGPSTSFQPSLMNAREGCPP